MGWILRMTVAAADSEMAISLLWDLHPTGIAEIGPAPEPTISDAGADDSRGIHTELRGATVELLAGFDGEAVARAAAREVVGWAVAAGCAPTVEPVDPAAWVDPDHRGDLIVGGHHLELEVGAAFGDGNHPSTRLALALLTDVLATASAGVTRSTPSGADPGDATDPPRATPPDGVAAAGVRGQRGDGPAVLDVGTGTGVLALAARALGAGPVTAVDNDPAAVAVAGRNVAAHPDLGSGIVLVDLLPAEGSFPVVVVNIVLGGQRDLAPIVRARLAPGGTLVVAGLLTTQETELTALHPDLIPTGRIIDGDWLGLALTAPPAPPPLPA